MNTLILEKRTTESLLYDIDCTPNLAVTEIISTISAPTADQGGLTFGTPIVNTVTANYPDGTSAAPGKAIQVRIIGGAIPAGSTIPDGRPGIACTVRATYLTTPQGNTREATVVLWLTNTPA